MVHTGKEVSISKVTQHKFFVGVSYIGSVNIYAPWNVFIVKLLCKYITVHSIKYTGKWSKLIHFLF